MVEAAQGVNVGSGDYMKIYVLLNGCISTFAAGDAWRREHTSLLVVEVKVPVPHGPNGWENVSGPRGTMEKQTSEG